MDRQQQMFSLVEEYQKSGLSIKAFSGERGLNHTTLSYWIAKKRKTENTSQDYPGFIPINSGSLNTPAGGLEITYPNGVKIRLTSADISIIRSLIHLL